MLEVLTNSSSRDYWSSISYTTRRILHHPTLRPYYRLAVIIVAINIYLLGDLLKSEESLSFAIIANFAIAILIRNESVINGLFKIFTSIPLSAPLWMRRIAAKVYHFGGIHIGAFFSGTVLLGIHANLYASGWLIPVELFHLSVLILMIVTALPVFRFPYHNLFEVVARFGTWLSWSLFVVQAYLQSSSVDEFAIEFLFLVFLGFVIALPWLKLKKVKVKSVSPSNHVVFLNFDYGVTPFAGSSTVLSSSPLLEWHSFANISEKDKEGFRLTVSNAGDWTNRLIQNPPEHIWIKGIPAAGVGNIDKLFKKVLWVATGSGIGPCLPHLLSGDTPADLIWMTRTPEQSYGEEFVNEVSSSVSDPVIWDTKKKGKPDLTTLVMDRVKISQVEAVICISNRHTTFKLCHEIESRGVSCYGAIWDS